MKARKTHSQGAIQPSRQQDFSAEQACSLVRQARLGVRTARTLLRGTQPTVQHLHALLRGRELNTHDAAQLGKETERLASVTQQLAMLTHAFASTVQNFLLEVTLKQYEEQSRSAPSNSPLSSMNDQHEEVLRG